MTSTHRVVNWLSVLAVVVAAIVGVAGSAGARTVAAAGHAGWHGRGSHKELNGIACPSAHLCVGIEATTVYVTTNITAKKPTWHKRKIEPTTNPYFEGTIGLDEISCPSIHFCATVDNDGAMFYTTNPAGKWTGEEIWGGDSYGFAELESISCASAHFCGAVNYDGQPMSSSNPEGGESAWHFGPKPKGYDSDNPRISCVGSSYCAYAVDGHAIDVSDNASSSHPKWHRISVKGSNYESVSCPTVHKCVAVGNFIGASRIAVSTDPTKLSSSAWKVVKIKHGAGFESVDCASAAMCMISADKPIWSSHAGGKASDWKSTHDDGLSDRYAVSCPSSKLCVAVGPSGVYVGRR